MDLHCEEEMLSESEGGTPSASASARKMAPGCDLANLSLADPANPTSTSLEAQASKDPALVNDDRVLQNMLHLEERLMHSSNAFKLVQTEITAEMRQSVTTWMWEVCEEEGVPESVFLRAVNYLDKFLSVQRIDRTQFQLLGAACMLISSKWTGSVISPHRLIYYTANSISQDLLLEWELLVLSLFKWEMFTMVPTDFMDQLLFRLPKAFRDAANIRETAKTYIACCATDYNFSLNPPSMIASSSIAASIGHHVPSHVLDQVLHTLHQVTNTETDVLRQCMEKVKMKIPVEKENFMVPGCMDDDDPGHAHLYAKNSHEINELLAETPTDVADIHF